MGGSSYFPASQAECVGLKSKHINNLKACTSFKEVSDKQVSSPTNKAAPEAGAEPLASVFGSSFGDSSLVNITDGEGLACKDCIKAQKCAEHHGTANDDKLAFLNLSPEALEATNLTCVVSVSLGSHARHDNVDGLIVGSTLRAEALEKQMLPF